MPAFNIKHIILATSALSLAACGSATTGSAPAINGANGKLKTVTQLLDDGATFTGSGSKITSLASGGKGIDSSKQVTYRKLSEGKYEFKIGFESFEVDAKDFNNSEKMYGKKLQNGRTVAFGLASEMGRSSKYDHTDFIVIIDGVEENDTTVKTSMQFADIGIKTQDMSTAGPKASYAGEFSSFFIGGAKGASMLDGKVNLDVDFTANTLSGSFNNIKDIYASDSGVDVKGSLNIESGKIDKNGYTGQLRADSDLNNYLKTEVKGSLNGSFYGSDAVETGGNFTVLHGDTMGTGAFAAKKQ